MSYKLLRGFPVGYIPRGGAALRYSIALTYPQRMAALGPLVYYRFNEAVGTSGAGSVVDHSGNSGRNATPSNVTFGVAGAGDGDTAASFNGTSSRVDVYSAPLASAFNKDEITFMAWVRPSGAGVWTDATNRHIALMGVDGAFSNYFRLYKTNADNTLSAAYIGGGALKAITLGSQAWTTWKHLAMVISKAGDYFRLYVDGVQQGADTTGLPTWTGALGADYSNIGTRDNSAVLVWSGDIAHAALFAAPLSTAQIQTVSSF